MGNREAVSQDTAVFTGEQPRDWFLSGLQYLVGIEPWGVGERQWLNLNSLGKRGGHDIV